MMYSFNYKQGTPSFDRVKSLVEYISDLAVAMVLVRQKALQDKGVFSAVSSRPDMFIATTTMS